MKTREEIPARWLSMTSISEPDKNRLTVNITVSIPTEEYIFVPSLVTPGRKFALTYDAASKTCLITSERSD